MYIQIEPDSPANSSDCRISAVQGFMCILLSCMLGQELGQDLGSLWAACQGMPEKCTGAFVSSSTMSSLLGHHPAESGP